MPVSSHFIPIDLLTTISYSSTISDFTNEIKKEVQDQCPLNLRQVEAFLENYACSRKSFVYEKLVEWTYREFILALKDAISSLSSTTPARILPTIHDTSTTQETVISSQLAYVDEDNDLKFVESDNKLYNTTEQNVFVVSFSLPIFSYSKLIICWN